MALTNGPNLGLLVNGNAGEGHYTDLMKQWRGLDALVMPVVDAYLVNTPPDSPADGYVAIIGAAPTGLWAGQGGKLTRWSTVVNAYEFFTPKNGWTAQSKNAREVYRHTGGAWEIFYQEGTWTPTISGSTTPGSNTYGYNDGKFVKNGSSVSCPFSIYMSNKDPLIAGNLSIAGLPFIPLRKFGGCEIGYMYGFVLSGAQLTAWPGGTSASVARLMKSGSPFGPLVAADLASSCELYGVMAFNI